MYVYIHVCIYIYIYMYVPAGPLRKLKHMYTARFKFGANVVIQVLFYRLSFTIRQIIRKECN